MSWVEGEQDNGVGSVVLVPLGGETLEIRAGYAESPELYAKNARPKRLEVVRLGEGWAPAVQGRVQMNLPVLGRHEVTLTDVNDWQELALPEWKVPAAYAPSTQPGVTARPQRPAYLALRVLEAYPGTTWEDLCISEIRAKP
ncbi:MAG: hypothetical protein GWP91_08885 [Rhodobacterales bacterium]|nr:hypothetical protein [Rhodobacterales bacterium]